MKVMHIIVGLDVGGAEMALRRLVLNMAHQPGLVPVVVSLKGMGAIGPQLRAAGVTVHTLGMDKGVRALGVLWQLARLIRQERPDVVQTWMYHADLIGGLAARLVGCRRVIWGIRTTEISEQGSRVTAMIRGLCAQLSHWLPAAIVCVAQAARQSHERLGYDGVRMLVIPNGFDLNVLKARPAQRLALRREAGLCDDDVVVGFVGRFHEDKGQSNFVKAAACVGASHPHVKFLMIGRGVTPDNAVLRAWIAATGFPERFALMGERSDLPTCYAAMDIFCLASRREAFPNVVGEAMAMGLPCVVTDVGDAALIVADQGMVVAKEDPEALAAGLGRYLSMPAQQRAAVGAGARQRIHDDYSMEACTRRFAELYERLLGLG
jgi:glycosyltransferase involved in cell wall biosynthesis